MKRELADYTVTPQVVKANHSTRISITPRGAHACFTPGASYGLRLVPMEQSIDPQKESAYPTQTVTAAADGSLHFTAAFGQEQLYLVRVLQDEQRLSTFQVYALLPDLFCRRPLKGDLHVHSYYSDGKEAPAVVAANYRKHGFDFMAITDHSRWFPSKEAVDCYKDIPTDLNLFYGEEIHVHGDYIHAVNFGGSTSVNEAFFANENACTKEVAALAKTLTVPAGVDALDFARRVWIANAIRKTGGLAIFVHPHWMSNAYNIPDAVSNLIFEQEIYDAFELLGGQSVLENNMQTALYGEQRAMGRKIPIVGSSDSHGTEPAVYFTDVFTLVFAKDTSLNGITTAIKELYSTAIESYQGESTRAHGTYRMVKYGMFLMQEYFPTYCELCFEQGRAMKDYVTGSKADALPILQLLKGRTDRYYQRFFGR